MKDLCLLIQAGEVAEGLDVHECDLLLATNI